MRKYNTKRSSINKKSYWIKSHNGVVASATFNVQKKPSDETLSAVRSLIDLAYEQSKSKPAIKDEK